MTALRLYAVVREVPPGSLGHGAEGEVVWGVACGAVTAIVGEVAGSPRVEAEALRRYDAAVRRLADRIDPLLPARFGEVVADEEALRRALEPRAAELAAALAQVTGCVQMTLRVFGDGTAPTGPSLPESVVDDPAGPGTRYLLQRQRAAERARSLPEIADLRSSLAPLLRAERIERHTAGRLLATAYDLVGRDDAARYAELVQEAAGRPGTPRLALSGPWPPYAFAVGSVP